MDKQEHINYWIENAEEDMKTVEAMFFSGRFVACLFFMHLSIEKMLKGHWVKDNASNTPTFTHDLLKLVQETSLEISTQDYEYLSIVNTWNINARYPDYKGMIYKMADKLYISEQLEKYNKFNQWLKSKI